MHLFRVKFFYFLLFSVYFSKRVDSIVIKYLMQSNLHVAPSKAALPSRGLDSNTDVWLQEMAQRDTQLWGCPPGMWIVNNKIYDLTKFVPNHPGGEHWLKMTQGQDVSVHFKVHHLNEQKAVQILQKYYVGECPKKQPSRFDFKQTGYYDELRSRVLQKYPIKDLQNSSTTKLRAYFVIFVWLLLISLASWLKSYLLGVITGCFMLNFYAIGHLFIHKGDNWLKHVFILIGMSAREQTIMHCLSHHAYPNTLIDYEFAAFQPIYSFTRCIPLYSPFRYFLMEIIFIASSFLNILTKLVIVPLVKKTRPSFIHALTLLEIVYIYFLSGDMSFSIKLFVLMLFSYGFIFGKTIVCPHRIGELWSEGAEEIRDYVVHTIATTSDSNHEDQGLKSILKYCGFNIHILHHLFPTIDHNCLFECNQIFNEFCKEKGLKIALNALAECNAKSIKMCRQIQPFSLKNFYAQ